MLPDVPSQHLEKVVAVNAPTHITLELISAARDCRFELCFLGVPVTGVETASNILGYVNLHAHWG
jgi:hypothetical protein